MADYTDQVQENKLSSEQSADLRSVLLKCYYMKTPERRQQVVSDFQKDFLGITFETNADVETQISIYIDRCLEFRGAKCFESFLNSLQGFEKAESDTMKAVWDVWKKIAPPPPIPDILKKPKSREEAFIFFHGEARRSREPDEFSKVGGEFHWDRKDWVDEFLSVVKGEPGKENICVMAFPAPPNADPDGFVWYLEAKCNALSMSSPLASRIVPIRLQLTNSLEAFPMVARILDLLASRSDECREHFREAAERIRKQWQPRETRSLLDHGKLARDFAGYLCEATKTCRPVVLLHSFEAASEDLRSWIMFTWLEVHQTQLAGTVVALAGNQGLGLEDHLKHPPHMVCRPPLGAMQAYDLWEWAYYGHGLTWLPLEFVTKYNREHMQGSARSFNEFIATCKALEQWCSKEVLLDLLSAQLESQH